MVLVSSELPELLGMSDRIVMLHEGESAATFQPAEVTPERLLAAAMGKARVDAAGGSRDRALSRAITESDRASHDRPHLAPQFLDGDRAGR